VKITEIYIDGFKNIKNTRLDFTKEPIIVLLAPNNFGKTNLLQAIQEGFSLIRKQGTEVVDYIRNRSYINRFASNGNIFPFTFEVKFFKRRTSHCEDMNLYHYKLVIDGNPSKTMSAIGVKDEFLKYSVYNLDGKKSLNNEETLFERDHNDPSVAILYTNGGKRKTDIKHSSHDKDDKGEEDTKFYPAEWNLFLHKLGNMALINDADKKDNDLVTVLKEIAGVLTSLTRENIGMIIDDEDSEYHIHAKLAKDAQYLKDENLSEYEHFETSFCKIFDQQYEGFYLKSLGVKDRFHLLFKGKKGEEDSSTLSYGTRRVFKLLSQICANKTPLVSIEEIENGLHPSLYKQVLYSFYESLDESRYNERNAKTDVSKKRKNEPRLIVSSHAPNLVNNLDNRLNAIYIGVRDDSYEGELVQFNRLNGKGQNELRGMIWDSGGGIGAGDAIFQLLSADNTKKETEKEWLVDES